MLFFRITHRFKGPTLAEVRHYNVSNEQMYRADQDPKDRDL